VHRGLHGFDALASRSDGLIERGLKPLIGFDQLRVLIRRGNRLIPACSAARGGSCDDCSSPGDTLKDFCSRILATGMLGGWQEHRACSA